VDLVVVENSNESHDRGSFERLYREHYSELLHYAARRVGADSAREVVADTFLIAWRRFDDIPHESSRAWLFGVARRVVANETRSGQRRARLEERVKSRTSPEVWVVPDLAQAVVDGEEIRALLSLLSPDGREALELIEWDGLSISEAAQVVGCTTGSFRVRLHRARRSLVELHRQRDARDQRDQHRQGNNPANLVGARRLDEHLESGNTL
jgi:RNA polymerase sigma-70 factor (ECF subfamily)